MTGPAGVMALVLAETAAGAAGFLFLMPLWREVKPGFFYLTGSIVLLLALGAAGSAHSALGPGPDPTGHLAVTLSLALTAATALWLVLMRIGRRGVARWLGIASVALAVAMLWAFARTADESVPLAFFQLLAGAVFIKATLRGARPSAVQSATGFFYLAVITAFTAELAAQVKFIP